MSKNIYVDTPLEKQPRPNRALLRKKITEKLPENKIPANQKPVVTVVTAVFNAIKGGRKEELLQCIDSVQEQTGVALEHLIIDGASQDGTVDLIRSCRNKNAVIRLLSEPDAGIYDAMNKGLWLADGEYVIFLNSDDYYSDPNGLAESVKALKESGADFSYAPVCVLDEETGKPVDHPNCCPNVNSIFVEMPFCHQSMVFQRKIMMQINGFDLRYRSAADYDSVLRLVLSGHRACFVPTRFATFRLGGFSCVYKEQSYKEVGQIYSRHYAKYFGFEFSPEDGREFYLSKSLPVKLKRRQFPVAQAAFGSAVSYLHHRQEDHWLDDDLLLLKNRLREFKWCKNIWGGIPTAVQLLFSSPVSFGKFLLLYCRYRLHAKRDDAGQKACAELLAGLQAKRRRTNSDGREEIQTGPNHPVLDISIEDFWCITGTHLSEPWGAWTGKELFLDFTLPADYVHHPLEAQVNIGGFVFSDSPKRVVDVSVNDRKIGTLLLENFMPQLHCITIPADAVTKKAMCVKFSADRTFSSQELGIGSDTRKLAMSFREMSIRKADDPGGKMLNPEKLQEIKVGFLNEFTKHWIGGVTYFKNLFQAMSTAESPRLRPCIFTPADESGKCLLPYADLFPEKERPADPNERRTAADLGVDIFSHLNDYQVVKGGDGIAWIADFQHLHLPEMFDAREIHYRDQAFHTLIAQNRIVCVSSYDAMEDFKKYAPDAVHKARCLHFVSIPEAGYDQFSDAEAEEIRRSRKLPERYFYVPNQFWKHKNHLVVLQAVSLLKKSGCPIHVVFSGNTRDFRFPHYFEEIEAFCHKEQIEENVHFLGLIPLKEVYFLMHECLAIINPSRFEGWSSSVEEAKSIGKTIFLSNLNVHYEQMPPQGTYFPCDDPEWLADLLKRAWRELKPGPDPILEEKAKQQLPVRIKQFGREFQQIVLDAIANRNSCETALQSLPEVTVVTVLTENSRKKSLLSNLQAAAAQQGVSMEHLIVNCGASDGTLKFLKPLLKQYGGRLISEPVHGIYGAMNLGAIHARGKYISYFDLEDHYESDSFLKESVEVLEAGRFDFSYTAAADETNCFAGIPFCHTGMLFLRKALYSVAGYKDTLHSAGDSDLLQRMIVSGKRGVRLHGAEAESPAGFPQKDMEHVQQDSAAAGKDEK